nr:unnamed protein product [Digitaria exilis]
MSVVAVEARGDVNDGEGGAAATAAAAGGDHGAVGETLVVVAAAAGADGEAMAAGAGLRLGDGGWREEE